MNNIEKWIDSIFENTIPNEVVGIAFNLYEDETNQWSIEMIVSASFDVEDPDWACDEVFDTRDNTLSWVQDATWEAVLQEAIGKIQKYIEVGKCRTNEDLLRCWRWFCGWRYYYCLSEDLAIPIYRADKEGEHGTIHTRTIERFACGAWADAGAA